MEAQSAKVWLVKSSGNILGPYALDEVIQLMTSKHISLIDEIRSPESRWTFIREHKLLSHVVQFVREQQSESREDTGATQTLRIQNFPGNTNEKNSNLKDSSFESQNRNQQQASSSDSDMAQSLVSAYDNQGNLKPGFAEGGLQPPVREQQPQKRTLTLTAGALFALGAIVIFLMGRYSQVASNAVMNSNTPKASVNSPVNSANKGADGQNKKIMSPEEAYKEFEHHWNFLDYEKALVALQNYEKNQILSPKEFLIKLQIMVQILFQNSNSEQLLANFDFSKVDEETKTELLNLKGIIQLNLGKYDDALMTFENLEKEDSTYEPAQFNLMTTHFLKGEFQEVIDQAKKMILAGTKDPAIFFMKNYSVFMQSSEKGKLDSAVEEINRISSKSLFLQNEFNLLAAGLQVKNGKIKEASITLQKLTRQDPELSENHAIQFQFARNSTQWKNLQPVCNSIAQGIGDPSSQVFVEAYCLTKSGDYLGAASKIDQGKLQAPADQRLLSLQGYLLWKLNKSNEINTYIQNNLKMNNELFHLVYGWYCLSLIDSACSEREMKSVLKLNPQNISALVGLTQKEIQAKNFDTAQKYLKQGLSVSENYRPLIQIKLQLAQTGPE